MGRFIGKPWTDEHGQQYAFCIVWGTLTRDAKVTTYKKTKAEVGIRYQRKQYMNVEVWSDQPCFPLLSGLETGDMVLVMGTYQKDTYTTRDGETKEKTYVKAEIVLPVSLLQFCMSMFAAPDIQKLLKAATTDAPADVMESAQDYDNVPNGYDPFAKEEDSEYEPDF